MPQRTINLNIDKLKIVRAYLEYFIIDWESNVEKENLNGIYELTKSEFTALNIIIEGLDKGQINFSMLNTHQLDFIIAVNCAKEIQYGDYYYDFEKLKG